MEGLPTGRYVVRTIISHNCVSGQVRPEIRANVEIKDVNTDRRPLGCDLNAVAFRLTRTEPRKNHFSRHITSETSHQRISMFILGLLTPKPGQLTKMTSSLEFNAISNY